MILMECTMSITAERKEELIKEFAFSGGLLVYREYQGSEVKIGQSAHGHVSQSCIDQCEQTDEHTELRAGTT